MTILLPKRLKLAGGTSTFARKLKEGMRQLGHEVVFNWQSNYDVLLASPRSPLLVLLDAKLRGKKIIQRLDGVYTPGTSAGRWWRLHNLPLSIIRKHFAHKIIYQSAFSRRQCEQYLPSTFHTSHPRIIYNGVDTEIFAPEGPVENKRENPSQHIFITWSRFRRVDQVEPLIKAFQYYREHIEMNSRMFLIGPLPANIRPASSPGVEMIALMPNSEIPRYARGADVFVISHLDPPCPNNVIEAMACGLPIVGTNTGAMPELVDDNGTLVDVCDTRSFAKAMHHAWQQRQVFGQHSRELALHHYRLDTMTRSYEYALT